MAQALGTKRVTSNMEAKIITNYTVKVYLRQRML